MPREIRPETTFDAVEDEVIFTRAAVKADPDASDLLPLTESWMKRVDEARSKDCEVRVAATESDAVRSIANARLDSACTTFGHDLLREVKNDRRHPKWLTYFKVPVSRFVRMALPQQVLQVQGWFASKDEVLLAHKPVLQKWATAADAALIEDRGLGVVRGENWQRRTELCEGLTRDRDGLHAALVDRAGERKLERDWPDLFFRQTHRPAASTKSDSASEVAVESPPPATEPASVAAAPASQAAAGASGTDGSAPS